MVEAAPWWVSLSASAVRVLPFGRYRAANALSRLASGRFVARMPPDLGGALFSCDLTDCISREVCFTGRYEPQETHLARRVLNLGMTAVDVGAHWGYFTLACAHFVGETGRVVALEPHPALARLLEWNARTNGFGHIECRRLAAGAARGITPLVTFPSAGGNSGLTRRARAGEVPDCLAETVPLDALLDERALDPIDLVKIDVEGAEIDVLSGMRGGLSRGRYRYVLLECHPAALSDAGRSLDDCLEPLLRAGYRGWQIDHSPAMHRRSASGPVTSAELLRPIRTARQIGDWWPHFIWAAPGAALPD